MSENTSASPAAVTANRFPNWPRIKTRPMPPLATLRFKGLSMFCYNQNRCKIGFLKDEDDRHKLRIEVWEYDPATPQIKSQVQLPTPTRMMTISLQNTEPDVRFLEQDPPSGYDFKNMLDLNSEEFWPGKDLKKDKFRPGLIVNNGTFLCLKLTDWTFDRVEVPLGLLERVFWPSNPLPLNYFLRIAGAEIGLTNNKKVVLTVDSGNPTTLPQVDGHSVEIIFDNECKEGNHDCNFDRDSRFETVRGDFHFHRKAMSVTIFDPKYGLSLTPGQVLPDDKEKKGTDLAPCMAVGAGDAPGLPPENS